MSVKIIADSTCDLSAELAEQYGIQIVPLIVMKDGREYKDQLTIVPEDMFSYTEKTGVLCTTAAVSIADYEMIYSKALASYDEVVHFTVSGELSSSYQNACIAAQTTGNVHVIDSRSICTGMGIQVVYAATLAAEGLPAEEIVAQVLRRRDKVDINFVISTLDYMARGGRCSSLLAFGANLLQIKPSMTLVDGRIQIGKKYRGSLKKCLSSAMGEWFHDPETIDTTRAFITGSNREPAIAAMVEDMVRQTIPFAQIYHTRIGCIIGGHCGPDCIGVVFYRT